MIIAKRVVVIKKNGERTDYSHVTLLRAMDLIFYMSGETDDEDKMRVNVHHQHRIKDLHITQIDWYIPPR